MNDRKFDTKELFEDCKEIPKLRDTYDEYESKESFVSKYWFPIVMILCSILLLI
jgi:hypothetical protein